MASLLFPEDVLWELQCITLSVSFDFVNLGALMYFVLFCFVLEVLWIVIELENNG